MKKSNKRTTFDVAFSRFLFVFIKVSAYHDLKLCLVAAGVDLHERHMLVRTLSSVNFVGSYETNPFLNILQSFSFLSIHREVSFRNVHKLTRLFVLQDDLVIKVDQVSLFLILVASHSDEVIFFGGKD